jgi:hydrogenase expression/formation protein HypC
MCLAIPGKVVEAYDQGGLRMAKVQFGGITREACLEYLPDTKAGEYVMVHVGFAISRVDEDEAERTYQALKELDQLTELDSPFVDEVDDKQQRDPVALSNAAKRRRGDEIS